MENLKTLKIAKQSGYYTLVIILLTFVVQGYLTIILPEKTLWLAIFTTLATLVVTYTYWIMLLGVATIAGETNNQTFIVSVKSFIRAVLVTCFVVAFVGLIIELQNNEIISLVLSIMVLASLVYLGIVSLKIAKGFKVVEAKYGKTVKRAIFWHKVSGYLMISVILGLFGVLTSLIADYFMWRLVCIRLKESNVD